MRAESRRALDEAAVRSSETARARFAGLRARRRLVVQVALASALAWEAAVRLLGDPQPFFAPIAAVIALNATGRRHVRQTVELIIGVAIGIGIADLLARLIGRGALQIGVVVAVAIVAATVLDGGPLLIGQAASSGILVVALAQPAHGLVPTRLLDALLGGASALLVSLLVLPSNADRQVTEAAEPVLDDIARAFDLAAASLREHDIDAGRRALTAARAAEQRVAQYEQAVAVGAETAQLAPLRRHARDAVGRYAAAQAHIAGLTRDARGLCRLVVQLQRAGTDVPQLAEAVGALADAVRALRAGLVSGEDGPCAGPLAAVRDALRATGEAPGVAGAVLSREVQSAAIDVLRAAGLDERQARGEVDRMLEQPAAASHSG